MASEVSDTFLYDASNEQTVIRAAIADPQSRKVLVRTLSTSEFLVPSHGPIWTAMIELTNKGLEYDPTTFRELLKNIGLTQSDFSYVAELEDAARLPKNLDYHVETMGWDATRARSLKGPIPELLEAVKDPTAPAGDVIAAARAVAKALEVKGGRRHALRPAEHHRSYMAEITARRAKRNVFPLGAPAFDANLTEGFMPGKTSILAGLPGAGKSTMALAWCVLLAMLGRRVTYCAWEMSPDSATDVIVSHMLKIPLKNIVQGILDDADEARVSRCVAWIAKHIKFIANPFYDELRRSNKRPSNDRNLDLLEGYIADSGSDVFVYDLWERCLFWTKPEDTTRALVRMQQIHKEYAIHGMILHQINLKDVERRADRRPTRDAIKGTAAYVEVADLIFGVHRDAQFKSVKDDKIETICLKQRKGKANWSIRWAWDGATCQIHDPEEVAFDPGLESAGEIGDIGGIKVGGKKRKSRRG